MPSRELHVARRDLAASPLKVGQEMEFGQLHPRPRQRGAGWPSPLCRTAVQVTRSLLAEGRLLRACEGPGCRFGSRVGGAGPAKVFLQFQGQRQ